MSTYELTINPPLFPLLLNFSFDKEIKGILSNVKPFVLASIVKEKNISLIITKDSLAERLENDLAYFIPNTYLFPLKEDNIQTPETIAEIRKILKRIKEKERTILIGGILSILKPILSMDSLDKDEISLSLGEDAGFTKTIAGLNKIGYVRAKRCEEKGTIAVRGGIVDIWPINYDCPLRCEFDEDRILSLRLFDPQSFLSFKNLDKASISPCISQDKASIFDYINDIILDEEEVLRNEVENEGFLWKDIRKRIKNPYSLSYFGETRFNFSPPPSFNGKIEEFLQFVKSCVAQGKKVIICCSYEGQGERMKDLLEESGVWSHGSGVWSQKRGAIFPISNSNDGVLETKAVSIVIAPISSGFSFDNTMVITHNEIFGRPLIFTSKHTERKINPISNIAELKIGDYAVHINCGIGKYLGIKSLSSCGRIKDFLILSYKDNDKLYIPVERIDLVERYVGPAHPLINRLGDGIWERTKKRVKEDTEEYARKLLSLYAEREAHPGHSFSPDTIWQHQLEGGFIYQETPDQIKAIAEIKKDMESKKPMDRLLVGDVGFGKTEVAIRAGFKAVMDGLQVAILVPTTILAHQHYNVFCERLAGFPINVGLLSRFIKNEKEVIEGLKNGNVDIIIATHRLLSKDISFKNLGLLIIDEEQRFGVAQKEHLKAFKKDIDCLSISATPIPRTLYLGMSGIKNISIINTPPKGREEIITHISEFSPELIEKAILKELERDGQVFFVHNSIETINKMADYIKALIPGISIGIAHGRLKGIALDKVMISFGDRKIDLLLSTSIIASGLDIPSVNTIIINSTEEFGLADIYQLRGRVGRRSERAYCYLLYPDKKRLKEKGKQRLLALKKFFSLGSSLSLALSDLEMRGMGNILGKEQNGNIKSIGLSLYTHLLEDAVDKIKGVKLKEKIVMPKVVKEDAFIPEEYIYDEEERFNIYKRLSSGYSPDKLKSEIRDIFGPIPKPTLRLLEGYMKIYSPKISSYS